MTFYRRSLFAWIALLGIIFSQLAVAAYACPVPSPANASVPAVPEPSHHEMAGMSCDDMDMAMGGDLSTDAGPSALCVQHCDQGKQTVSSIQAPDFQPALFLLMIVPSLDLAQPTGDTTVQASLLTRTTSPPPLWRSGRLRI